MTRDFWNIIIIPPNHLQVHNKARVWVINSADCVGQDLLIARVRLAANKCVNYTAYHNLTEITYTQGDGVDIYIWCKLHIHSQIKADVFTLRKPPHVIKWI